MQITVFLLIHNIYANKHHMHMNIYIEVLLEAHKSEVLARRSREEAEKVRLPQILKKKNEWWAVSHSKKGKS
jgi:hypothetical protein